MLDKLKTYLPYLVGFAIVACLVFYPELQGKKLSAHDAISWYEAAKEYLDYQKKGEQISWTNRIFSGMPLYTVAGGDSGNFIGKYYSKFMDIFPNNVANLFVVFLCGFISLLMLRVRKKLAFILAIALGLNTWILDSLWASHPTKILSMAYILLVVSGFISFIRKPNWFSFICIVFGMSMSVGYAHYQIVYYGGLVCGVLAIYFLIESIRLKNLAPTIKSMLIVLVAVIIGLSTNAYSVLLTQNFNKETMRGGKTELVKPEANSTGKDGGLDINYAFSWSYSWPELFNFIVPDAMGGSSNYMLKTAKYKLAGMFYPNQEAGATPVYWGIQPFTGAPNYVGASVMFLFIFSLIYWQNKFKYVLLFLFVMSMFMGLGKSFLGFNELLFDYLPMYNKFRTPTMSFSILNAVVILTIGLGFNEFLNSEWDKDKIIKTFKHTIYVMLGIMIVGYIAVSNAGYTSLADVQMFQQNNDAIQVAIEDRASLFKSDFFRSLLIIAVMAGVIWLFIKNNISKKMVLIIIGVVIFLDLFTVYRRYLTYDVFQKVEKSEDLIPDESYNRMLEQDKSYFRIFNTTNQSVFNSNTDGYRFSNVGGYSPAKLYRYQDLIDVHLSKGNMPVLNMLNTKYIIIDNQGQKMPQQNPDAAGNAWFVSKVNFAKNANEEMDSIGTFNPRAVAWVDQRYKTEGNFAGNTDPNATISLTHYHPENLTYQSNSSSGGFAVFSEIWYKGNEDWKIFVDGKETKMIRTDYLLRGAYIPAGSHKIEMKFHSKNADLYRNITFAGSVLMLLSIFAFLYFQFFKNSKKQ